MFASLGVDNYKPVPKHFLTLSIRIFCRNRKMNLPKKIVCSVCHKFVSTSNLARHARIHAYCAVCQAWINRKSHVHNANALRNDDEDLLNRIRVNNGLSY